MSMYNIVGLMISFTHGEGGTVKLMQRGEVDKEAVYECETAH